MRELYYLPIALNLRGKKVLIVGGGTVAYRKALTMLKGRAEVTVLAPELSGEIEGLVPKIRIIKKNFDKKDITDFDIVIAATDNRKLNKEIGRLSSEKGKLVNVADTKYESDFVTMALVEKGEIIISIFSDARDPQKVVEVKKRIEELDL